MGWAPETEELHTEMHLGTGILGAGNLVLPEEGSLGPVVGILGSSGVGIGLEVAVAVPNQTTRG